MKGITRDFAPSLPRRASGGRCFSFVAACKPLLAIVALGRLAFGDDFARVLIEGAGLRNHFLGFIELDVILQFDLETFVQAED